MHIRTSLLALFALTVLLLNPATSSAQDVYTDSVFTKLKLGTKFIKDVNETGSLKFNEKEFDGEHQNEDDGKEYGIGNILGKKKKTNTANKKTGKSIKIELDILGKKVIDYEVIYQNGFFQLQPTETDD